MRRDQEVTGDRRSWWFWPTIVIVIAAVVVLIAWTLIQTGAVGPAATGPPPTDPMTAIAARAICSTEGAAMRHDRRRMTAMATMLAALMTILLAVPASANQGMTQIAGSAVPADGSCPEPLDGFEDFTLRLSGDLVGCWYTHVEDARYIDGSGIYLETGRERFVGCLGDECGTFDTTYRFTAKFTDPELTQEIHGRCQHPITRDTGSGDFTGVTGRVDFKDDVDAGIFNYRGHVRI